MNNENWSERRRFLENLCEETGGRMGCHLADELDALRAEESAGLNVEAHGDGALDSLVLSVAADVNAAGFKEQVRFLNDHGWSEEEILAEIEE